MIQSLLHELVNRIEHLRDTLSNESFHPQINQLYLQETQQQLHKLKLKVVTAIHDDSWGLPGTNSSFYSEYQRSNEHLLHLEYYGVQVLRQFGEPELYFNSLMRRLWREMGVSGTPPLVTTISTNSNYFWAMASFNLIGAPPGEEAHLLNIPDIIHETGHVLLNYYNQYQFLTGDINDYIETVYKKECYAIEDQDRSKEQISKLLRWKKYWLGSWQVEFACDLMATYFMGPAYAWTNLKLSAAERLGDVYDTRSESHPSHEARMRCINVMLTRMGHLTSVSQVESTWDEFLTLPGYTKPVHYDIAFPTELIERLAQTIYEGCGAQGWLSYDQQVDRFEQPVSLLLNEAWEILQTNPEEFYHHERKIVSMLRQSFSLS